MMPIMTIKNSVQERQSEICRRRHFRLVKGLDKDFEYYSKHIEIDLIKESDWLNG